MRSSPSSRADALARLVAFPFAHRGLHGPGAVENSRAAFETAIAADHGIELDVQASRDGDAFVFHDYALARLTRQSGTLRELPSAELGRVTLAGTFETIPTLPAILELIAGRAPLLIEVKSPDRRATALCRSVSNALTRYAGPVGVMSFNPAVGHYFARHDPDILRGLVVTEADKRNLRGRIERGLALRRARPDFLAYDIRDLPSAFARKAGLAVLTWTVRSDAERATAALYAGQIIYETPR